MTIYYKAFNRDMTCRDFQYEEGGIYEIEDDPILCEKGFHFVKDLVLSLGYYPVNNDITENFYAEVEPLGDVVWEEPTKHKGCTNKLKIVRVIPDDEVKRMVDAKNNSGKLNSGNRNSGYGNSGDWNSGNRNSGNRNSGNGNSGYGNSGDWNSGNWNSCDFETGAFNTTDPETIRAFNQPCNKEEWDNAYKPDFLYFDIKDGNYKASFQESWDSADKDGRERVRDLPNFDAEVFYELSGIDLREKK